MVAPEEDSGHRFPGPVIDVSPIERPTEEIEIIDIPAPEPSDVTPVSEDAVALTHVAVPAEANGDGIGNSPEELTAIEVEAFLRDHAAGTGPGGSGTGSEMASAIGVKSDSDSDSDSDCDCNCALHAPRFQLRAACAVVKAPCEMSD